MTDTTNGKGGQTAPYPSFASFKSFISDLVEKGLPDRIDRTVIVGRSGTGKSALKGALDFLGLINAVGVPSAAFKDLKEKIENEAEWKPALGEIITDAYAPIIGDLSLTNGTAGQLATRFRENGNVSGATLTSAVRFYLAALDDAGIDRSERLKAPPRSKSSKKRRAKGGDENGNDENERVDKDFTPDVPIPDGWVSQPMYLPGRPEPIRIVIPTDLKAWEWELVNAYIAGYVERNEKKASAPGDTDDEFEMGITDG